MTRLIVNADDLGYTTGVNRGIVAAHEHGIVTSASLMVDRPGAEDGAGIAATTPALGVGLHAVVDGIGADHCEQELERQLVRFLDLVRREPTHVDSHHHAHRDPSLLPAFEAFADRHGLPLRDRDAQHCGEFYGEHATGVGRLLDILGRLDGDTVELACHPGFADGLQSRYLREREFELRTLTDDRVAARVDGLGIELVRWSDLR